MNRDKSLVYNVIFIGVIIISIVVVIFSLVVGNQQDEQFIMDYKQYATALALEEKGRNSEAEKILANLIGNYQDNYLIQWRYGVLLLKEKKYTEAENHLRLAREIRPALVTAPNYLLHYGETLYNLGEYEDAKSYLVESQKYNNKGITNKSQELMKAIQNEERK